MSEPKRILISKDGIREYRVYHRGKHIQIDCFNSSLISNDNKDGLEFTELLPKRLIQRIHLEGL